MSKVDLDALEALEKAATPTNWQALHSCGDVYGSFIIDHNRNKLLSTSSYGLMRQDASLIAAMRNNIKPMIEELWTLRKLADAFKKAQEEHYCNVPIEVHDAVAEYEKLMGCEK